MILIADSGSTKTDWSLVQGATVTATAATQGINPFYQSDDDIARIVGGELLPQIGDANAKQVEKVCFYGAGVRPEMRERVKAVLSAALHVDEVEVEGDLVGAARALLGTKEGIACILGRRHSVSSSATKAVVPSWANCLSAPCARACCPMG